MNEWMNEWEYFVNMTGPTQYMPLNSNWIYWIFIASCRNNECKQKVEISYHFLQHKSVSSYLLAYLPKLSISIPISWYFVIVNLSYRYRIEIEKVISKHHHFNAVVSSNKEPLNWQNTTLILVTSIIAINRIIKYLNTMHIYTSTVKITKLTQRTITLVSIHMQPG